MKNSRLIVAIITSLLDEAVIIAIIIFGLPRLGINIPLYGIILIGVAFLLYAVGFYTVGSRILRKKPTPGFTNMVSLSGRAVSRLAPKGYVRVAGELWEAKAESGAIDKGMDVIVIEQYGLKLIVRPKTTNR